MLRCTLPGCGRVSSFYSLDKCLSYTDTCGFLLGRMSGAHYLDPFAAAAPACCLDAAPPLTLIPSFFISILNHYDMSVCRFFFSLLILLENLWANWIVFCQLKDSQLLHFHCLCLILFPSVTLITYVNSVSYFPTFAFLCYIPVIYPGFCPSRFGQK